MNNKSPRGSLARKKGLYYIIVYFYENDVRRSKTYSTGIPVESQNKRVAAKNERTAREKMTEILRQFQPPSANASTPTSLFADDVRAWLQRQKNSIAASTYAGYAYAAADVVDYFSRIAPIKTVDLAPSHIETYVAWERTRRQPGYIPPDGEKKVKTRTTDGAGIDNTIMRRIAVIRSVLQSAKRDGIISKNPCAKRDSSVKCSCTVRKQATENKR